MVNSIKPMFHLFNFFDTMFSDGEQYKKPMFHLFIFLTQGLVMGEQYKKTHVSLVQLLQHNV